MEVAATVAGGQGRDGTEVPPPHYSTSSDLKFSYSEINFQDLSWSFRNLYKSMLEKSSSSQHGERRQQGQGGGSGKGAEEVGQRHPAPAPRSHLGPLDAWVPSGGDRRLA